MSKTILAEKVTQGMVICAHVLHDAEGLWLCTMISAFSQHWPCFTALSDFKPNSSDPDLYGTITTAELGAVNIFPRNLVFKIA